MTILSIRATAQVACVRRIVTGALLALPLGLAMAANQSKVADESVSAYACGGKLEGDVWRQWDARGFDFAQSQLIEKRLIANGDTYALYDFQTLFHNLLAMAQRCQRIDRQLELAALVNKMYAGLSPTPNNQPGRAWVCRGGAVCNSTNRLVNTEVMLTSVQFLAFASSLAQSLNKNSSAALSHDFAEQTAQIALEHLQRWGTASARAALGNSIPVKPQDLKNGSSAHLLLDRHLWQIAIYADLASLLASQPKLLKQVALDKAAFTALQAHLSLLLRLFNIRTTTQLVSDPQAGKTVKLADLDAGFWRLYGDNRYAGYTGSDKPVVCKPKADKPKTFEIETRIKPDSIEPVATLGWDISHARRLVHFFDAIERNRGAMRKVFGIEPTELPSQATMEAFARQLNMRVWNQDTSKPLFTNYFNGANGWYRVAYDNGTGRCMEGYPPFGLTDSFPTGGYATWGALVPKLRILGERLYELTQSGAVSDQIFVKAHYPKLGQTAKGNERLVAELMFWPSLIHK